MVINVQSIHDARSEKHLSYQNTQFRCNTFFRESCRLSDMWKNIIQLGRPQMAVRSKSTNTYSQYAIIIAFTLQQLLHKRDSMLRFTYIACLDGFNLKIIVKNKYLNYV